jgi:hypothetical protein
VEAFYDVIGCEFKMLAMICELNHYSLEEMQGKPFKPFACPRWCPYKATSRAKWRAEVEAHEELDEATRKEEDLAHSRDHLRHYKLVKPTYELGAMDLSADLLQTSSSSTSSPSSS